MPLESWLLVNFKLLAVESLRAAYKRCNEYGCWMSCCEPLTAACATAFATLSISVVDAVKPLSVWRDFGVCGRKNERTNGMEFEMSKHKMRIWYWFVMWDYDYCYYWFCFVLFFHRRHSVSVSIWFAHFFICCWVSLFCCSSAFSAGWSTIYRYLTTICCLDYFEDENWRLFNR